MHCKAERRAISARHLDIKRETLGSLMNGKGKTQTGKLEVTLLTPTPVTLYPATIAGKRVTSLGSAGERGEIKEGGVMAELGADRWLK